ncbi:DUF4394 domain-containing protein [Hymenobacter sp. ASUV-10]|uniref:DUF4394 domain-containing protein n=1 Tax=Hymenobacter aranciens TaxID=3063996 RepID=A0ABT9BBY3_9BACT|nr:DUF4394 domain-containing protein [Hymenobacter sp. ASUV-10]MDO7875776.1 DUF4394 domain-containing protein [Hymenobacter sp. ASUV-10]
MHTPLLPRPTLRRGILPLLGTAAGLAMLFGPVGAQAQTMYGLGTLSQNVTMGANPLFPAGAPAGTQGIFTINPANGQPTTLTAIPVTGVAAGQRLVGMDYRPNTGEAFVLGYDATTAGTNSQLYTLNTSTGAVTAVGAAQRLELGGTSDRVGFDFNPTVDRIRVVSTSNANYRLNPNNGAIVDFDPNTAGTQPDGSLAYADGTPADANVGAVAYTNSYRASSNTTLYDIDEVAGILSTQNPPNNGVLVDEKTIALGVNPFGNPLAMDMDVSFFTTPGTNEAFLMEVSAADMDGLSSSNLYSINLATGAATLRGNTIPAFAGTPFNVEDIAVSIPAPAALTAVTGQLVYGVTASNNLITFDSSNPSIIRTVVGISGLPATQTLVGTDFRPNTGQLFGLGYNAAAAAGVDNAQLYTINLTTGAATAVGAAIRLELGGAMDHIAFDFNPTVDRIRVEGTSDANYRLNPNNGAIVDFDPNTAGVQPDGNLNYAAGDAGAGQNPTVGTGAYTNSFVGSTATGLYTLDHALGYVSFQNPPNNGTLTNSRSLTGVNGAGVGGAIAPLNDLDIYYNGTTNTNVPYLVAAASATPNASRLFTLNALSPTDNSAQVATDGGAIGLGISVRDISVTLAGASVPNATAAVTGQLLYGLAGGSLVSFDSGDPSVIRSAVNFGGGITTGQTVVGIDFRPANGQLYALGYNPAIAFPTNNAQLYTVNLTSGALTAVGSAISLNLGSSLTGVGFDFNPTVDRIRVVASNNANYRLNPNNGLIAFTDPNLNGQAGAYTATAYTNSQSNANTTAQFVFDSTTGAFTQVTNPNGGVVSGPVYSVTGTSTTTGGDFDIYNTPGTTTNQGFIATAASSASANDNLYIVGDFGSPFNFTVNNAGLIGQGTNLTGLAAFLSGVTGLTWNGSVSTDWGTAANWTPNMVPMANSDVTIPSGTPNQPSVSNAQQARLVTINAGATLTLANGGTLTTGGNFTNNGTVTGSGTGTLVQSGTGVVIGGTGLSTFPNLTTGALAASTGGPVAIQRALTLNGNFTIGAGQPFTLLSSATGTAYVVNNGNSAVLLGTATVQRYIDPSLNAGLGYRHYSSPVSGNTVADLSTNGFAPVVNPAYNNAAEPGLVTPFPNVFAYDQARVTTNTGTGTSDFDRGYFSPASTGDAMGTAQGYTVNIGASSLVDFTGTANNGLNPINVTGLGRGALPQSGWHLRGNPFPSPLNWQAMIANNRLTGMESALYVFKSSGQYTGSYASYVAGIGNNGGSSTLPVAQGFFVRTAAGQTGSLSFTNSERLTTDPGTAFQRTGNDPRTRLALTLANNVAANQTTVYFDATATSAFDANNDAAALPAPNGLTLATEAGTEQVAINGLPTLNGSDVLLPLHVAARTAGTYTLSVNELNNLPSNYHAYLRDALTGTFTDLSATPSLSLTLAANAPAAGRYALLFTTQARVLATAPQELAQLVSVYPNPAHGTATLVLPAALRGAQATQVQVLDNTGRVVLSRTLAAGATEALQLPLGALNAGIYTVQAKTAVGLVAKRLVVQ